MRGRKACLFFMQVTLKFLKFPIEVLILLNFQKMEALLGDTQVHGSEGRCLGDAHSVQSMTVTCFQCSAFPYPRACQTSLHGLDTYFSFCLKPSSLSTFPAKLLLLILNKFISCHSPLLKSANQILQHPFSTLTSSPVDSRSKQLKILIPVVSIQVLTVSAFLMHPPH